MIPIHSTMKKPRFRFSQHPQSLVILGYGISDLCGPILAPVLDDEDFPGIGLRLQESQDLLQTCRESAFLIKGRDDDR